MTHFGDRQGCAAWAVNTPGGTQRRFVPGWASGSGRNRPQGQTLTEFPRLFNSLQGVSRQRPHGPRPPAARDGAEPQRRAAAASALGAARRSHTGLKMAAAAAGGCRVSAGREAGGGRCPQPGPGLWGGGGSPGRAAPLLSFPPLPSPFLSFPLLSSPTVP